LVPASLKYQLDKEDALRRIEAEAALQAEMDDEPNPPSLFSSAGPPKSPKLTKQEEELRTEAVVWEQIDARDRVNRSKALHPVFQSAQARALHRSMVCGDRDERQRLEHAYSRLVKLGTLRRVARPPSVKPLERLASQQPHMREVVQFVIDQLMLGRRSRHPVRLQPMLLVGEAGVGKTHFAQALAKALATTVHVQQLDSDITGAFLLGSDKKWGNTKTGVLFQELVLGEVANPVMVLDEIDKGNREKSSPVGSFYSVLEPLSAKTVRDISADFEFDASLVTWIATANDASKLDAPLRSRFREFHILPPNAEECLALAGEVMRAAIKAVGVRGFDLDVSLRRHLAHLPARQISQLTTQALARAVASGRRSLSREDFPRWLFDQADGPQVAATYLH
jgi:ATP-dependent Lon protease